MPVNEFTSIAVRFKTKRRLDDVKLCADESYESLLNRLLDEREQKAREAV